MRSERYHPLVSLALLLLVAAGFWSGVLLAEKLL